MEEQWKQIKGYENEYLISSYGRVKTLYTNKIRGYGSNKKGYLNVVLYKNGERKFFAVHRLVASHFIPNPNNYPCVDHIDTNPRNNNVENLRWCTYSMNARNPQTYQRMRDVFVKANIWVNNNHASVSVVRISKEGYTKNYPSQSEAQRDGFSQSKVSECCKGVRKTHKGYRWMYADEYNALHKIERN